MEGPAGQTARPRPFALIAALRYHTSRHADDSCNVLGQEPKSSEMFERAKEYLKFGAGRPPGTIWAMEKAYFELRHKYPDKEEYAYLRLALQSRYPDKPETEIHKLASECRSLDDAIVAAIEVDFGHHVALRIRMDVLWNLPACSRCGKYRAQPEAGSARGPRTRRGRLSNKTIRRPGTASAPARRRPDSELARRFAGRAGRAPFPRDQ
jgi:hypothetical protein